MTGKESVQDLALFGAAPLFTEKLHVGRPNLGNRDDLMARINGILDRRWFTNDGECAQELEKKLTEFLGVKHCILMCNATIALEITARALGMKGEVIVPSFTFVATPHSLQWQEITPVFCDIDPWTHNIDPARVEEMITSRTTGIIGVHIWGRPCAIEALAAISARHGLKLMFDAAHAFGCSHNGRMIGGFGCAEVFSFHATKFFNTFEGGAVATDDDELATKIRLMKNFGFKGYDSVGYLGTNGKMNELSAAMGLVGLESIDQFVETNRRNHSRYREDLSGLPGVTLVDYPAGEKYNYQYIVCEIDEKEAGVSRDLLVEMLHAENVIARRYFYPGCHKMEPYRTRFPQAGFTLPQTERLSKRVFTLPTGTAVAMDDIDKICQLVRVALALGPELVKGAAARL